MELKLQELPNLIGFAKTNVMRDYHSSMVQVSLLLLLIINTYILENKELGQQIYL